jgi:hypothetical protein
MKWLVFSYSLSSKSRSSPRVTLWRRLRRIGSISMKTGVYVLPVRDECIEAFQWLMQEVQQVQGDALVSYVEQFEGLNDQQIIELFRQTRQQDYLEIDARLEELEKKINSQSKITPSEIKEAIAKLKKRYNEILTIDFFDCSDAQIIAARLTKIEQYLQLPHSENLVSLTITKYQNKRWVTRPRPFVDRLACIWLIRKFIDPDAIIRYSWQPETDEIAFDMKKAEFGHQGNLCSFETMMLRFDLKETGVIAIAKIVHELDLRDGQYISSEAVGVETILRGWLLANFTDLELESLGIKLFEGLYFAFSQTRNS